MKNKFICATEDLPIIPSSTYKKRRHNETQNNIFEFHISPPFFWGGGIEFITGSWYVE